jgi:hypothetical protein
MIVQKENVSDTSLESKQMLIIFRRDCWSRYAMAVRFEILFSLRTKVRSCEMG